MNDSKLPPLEGAVASPDAPNIERRNLTNIERRPREYLTPAEMDKLEKPANFTGAHAQRNRCMVMVAYRHGLRVSELCELHWRQFDLASRNPTLHVNRVKQGRPSVQPVAGDELRELRKLTTFGREGYVFLSNRGGPLSRSAVQKMMIQAGAAAGLDALALHPHMLRHARGYKLANEGRDTRSIQAYLGHTNIQHTVIYTDLAPDRFKDFSK